MSLRDSGLVLIRLAELKQRMEMTLRGENFELGRVGGGGGLAGRAGVRTRFLHYSSRDGSGAASRKRLLRGDASGGPVQFLRQPPLLPQQGHHYHVVEGIAFAGELAQHPSCTAAVEG